jgi:glycerate-2-kinase
VAQKIKNFKELATTPTRTFALEIAESGLQAIDTRFVVRSAISFKDGSLCIRDKVCAIEKTERVFVVAIGKCAMEAGSELESVLGDRLTGGIVLDVESRADCPLKKLECIVGTHPMPSDTNVEASKKIVKLLTGLRETDLVIFVVSGGGSTLLCLPEEGSSCLDEKVMLADLFKKGATIQEINLLRKHMSYARGGFLAKAAYPAQVISLIFSDVPGNDISMIASGPTVKDETTIADADGILEKYDLLRTCKLEHCGLIETPKEDKYFTNVSNMLIASNEIALKAMAKTAEAKGYDARIITTELVGEADDIGKIIAERLHGEAKKTVLLYGGETTVTIVGPPGKGGRNQELALSALRFVKEGELIMPIASDGRDHSDRAGAIADVKARENMEKLGLTIEPFLKRYDPYTFYETTGDYLATGDTGSNISDLLIAMKE